MLIDHLFPYRRSNNSHTFIFSFHTFLFIFLYIYSKSIDIKLFVSVGIWGLDVIIAVNLVDNERVKDLVGERLQIIDGVVNQPVPNLWSTDSQQTMCPNTGGTPISVLRWKKRKQTYGWVYMIDARVGGIFIIIYHPMMVHICLLDVTHFIPSINDGSWSHDFCTNSSPHLLRALCCNSFWGNIFVI